MAEHSMIEWTDATWNLMKGCSLASPGGSLRQSAGDFSSMIRLGPRDCMTAATPAMVLERFAGRGIIHLVPEVFRTGHRGRSSYLFATDGSELTAWMPVFGANPWATSPEVLLEHLVHGGLEAAISSDVPAWAESYVGMPYGGQQVQPYAPRAAPAAAPPAPVARRSAASAPAPSAAQPSLFG